MTVKIRKCGVCGTQCTVSVFGGGNCPCCGSGVN